MELGKIIKKHRELNNWSQDELADRLHVSRQSVSKWESGHNYPSLDILVVLSDIFDITLDELVKGDNKLKKRVLEGEYGSSQNTLDKHRGRTIGDFLAGYWWIVFPIGGFLTWFIHQI
ncbi:TPA: helix-turn-helix domain-containing protein [Staphylococcus aureus]|nr:helix-turn-helix transcriptional regulator [Staphylococcus aureus]